MDDLVIVNRIVWDQLIEQVPWGAGEARQAFPPMDDKVVIDRARFDRLLAFAVAWGMASYKEDPAIYAAFEPLLQEGDLPPLP